MREIHTIIYIVFGMLCLVWTNWNELGTIKSRLNQSLQNGGQYNDKYHQEHDNKDNSRSEIVQNYFSLSKRLQNVSIKSIKRHDKTNHENEDTSLSLFSSKIPVWIIISSLIGLLLIIIWLSIQLKNWQKNSNEQRESDKCTQELISKHTVSKKKKLKKFEKKLTKQLTKYAESNQIEMGETIKRNITSNFMKSITLNPHAGNVDEHVKQISVGIVGGMESLLSKDRKKSLPPVVVQSDNSFVPFGSTFYYDLYHKTLQERQPYSKFDEVVHALSSFKRIFYEDSQECSSLEEQIQEAEKFNIKYKNQLRIVDNNNMLTKKEIRDRKERIELEYSVPCRNIIMTVWKNEGKLFRYINIALFLDVVREILDIDIPEYYEYAFSDEKKPKDYYITVIKHSVQFILLMKETINSSISTCPQIDLFRGINWPTLENSIEGKTYMFLNFQSSSESRKQPWKKFMGENPKVSILKVRRGERWQNTARFYALDGTGKFPEEKEWLTMPYSKFTLNKYINLDLQNGKFDLALINDEELEKYLKRYQAKNKWENLTYWDITLDNDKPMDDKIREDEM